METGQHTIQDSCEAYAVYVMQKTAEDLGKATTTSSHQRWAEFVDYLVKSKLTLDDFTTGEFAKYKRNVDLQVPLFVERLVDHYNGSTFVFENVEAAARNDGMKADVHVHVSGRSTPVPLSIKNYIGSGGITRPQVSSGTFLSFACGFVFDRIGVGKYEDRRPSADRPFFMGSNAADREAVLESEGRPEFSKMLAHLVELNDAMRADLLGDDCVMYNQARVRAAVNHCADAGIATTLAIFDRLGNDRVREKFLARIGMDGKEEALFFDSEQYVDSITRPRYHQLRDKLNSPRTQFAYRKHKQGIRFEFTDETGKVLLGTDVPLTINTNGAWHRPDKKKPYEGKRIKNDKGHDVELEWGERRPYKSRELATSTNTYLNLQKTGIFAK